MDGDRVPLDGEGMDNLCYRGEGRGISVFVTSRRCMMSRGEFTETRDIVTLAPCSNLQNSTDDRGHGSHNTMVVVEKKVWFAKNAEFTSVRAFDRHGNSTTTNTTGAINQMLEKSFAMPPFVVLWI